MTNVVIGWDNRPQTLFSSTEQVRKEKTTPKNITSEKPGNSFKVQVIKDTKILFSFNFCLLNTGYLRQ